MPEISGSTAMTANQTGLSLLDQAPAWQFRYVGFLAACKALLRATTTGVRVTIYSSSRTVKQRSIVQGGGTAGTTPSDLNTNPYFWVSLPGEYLQVIVDEVSGGTPTVDYTVTVEQAR